MQLISVFFFAVGCTYDVLRTPATRKKRLVSTSRFFIDINLLRDFRYVINDSICADALDMLPCGNEIYII